MKNLWMGIWKACLLMLAALSPVIAEPDPNFHIYLAFGQSNMEGLAGYEEDASDVDARFTILNSSEDPRCPQRLLGEWRIAYPPLAHCHAAMSPLDYFGRNMVDSLPDSIRVGVVVVAVGGSSIRLFDKDEYEAFAAEANDDIRERIDFYGGNPYARLVEMAQKAQESGVIKGILLHQGESDLGDEEWPKKVKKVYEDLVEDLGLSSENIPLIAGEVHHEGWTKDMNKIINQLPMYSPNFFVVSAEGIEGVDSADVHFLTSGVRELGARYAALVLELPERYQHRAEQCEEKEEPLYCGNIEEVLRISKENWDVKVHVKQSGKLNVRIFSALGRERLNISDTYKDGENAVALKGRLSRGIYILNIRDKSFRQYSRKIRVGVEE